MTYENILGERDDGVGIVTLNRPNALNAMNRKLGAELLDAVRTLEADDEIGCLVITGAGDKAFSAGGDIREQHRDEQLGPKLSVHGIEDFRSVQRDDADAVLALHQDMLVCHRHAPPVAVAVAR